MPLTANSLPSQTPSFAVPFDAQAKFADAQTLTATGYLQVGGNPGQIDLGSSNTVNASSSAGRYVASWILNITAIDFANNDETYRFFLLGSNDVAFGNGNVECLAAHDFAAVTAGRFITPLLGASPANAPFVQSVPFVNLWQKIVYRFLRAQCVITGTTPSVTVTSWISSPGIGI
jgi:hypothetical protein